MFMPIWSYYPPEPETREFENKVDVKVSISCIIELPLQEAVWNLCGEISEWRVGVLRRFIFLFDSIGRMSPAEEEKPLEKEEWWVYHRWTLGMSGGDQIS